jgi:hypothetical protein
MSPRQTAFCVIAGLAWGVLAYALGVKAIGSGIWGGVLAAPFIGPAVGLLTQGIFERTAGWRQTMVSLASLYLGATLFGLAVGVSDAIGGPHAVFAAERIYEDVIAMWWGVTLTGFVIVLWPLTYFTHKWIEGKG